MSFAIPFTINSKNQDYVLSKEYEEEAESYLLKIPANTQIAEAITLKLNSTAGDLNFKLTVQLEENSSATIIEDWSQDVQAQSVNYELEIICESNSDLKYIVLNHVSDKTKLTEKRMSKIADDAKCQIYAYHFGAKKVDSKMLQEAAGKGAEVQTNIIAKSTQEQDLSFNCEHFYTGKEGSGEIGMKGIAEDKAMLNFDGMVNIAQTGGGSAGYLQQETLNLSPTTIVKATPGLKIDTNDVKAGHGASVRNLNEEDFYYFGARGIGQEEAKKLLVTGFLGAELEKVKEYEGVYEVVKKMI